MEVIPKTRKSVALTKEEWSALKKFRAKFLSGVECAEAIGIDRNPLDRIMSLGKGSQKSILKIRAILNQPAESQTNTHI